MADHEARPNALLIPWREYEGCPSMGPENGPCTCDLVDWSDA